MVAIAGGKPVQMGLRRMLEYYIEHQKNVVTRRTKYELAQAEARAHILEGLIVAVDNLDEVIQMIRSSKTPKEARDRLMSRFALTAIQAQAILDMRLQRLTNLEVVSLREEYAQLTKRIAGLKAILNSEKKLLGVIKKELGEIREKFADARRTEIVPSFEAIVIDEEIAAPDEARVLITRNGFIKRMQPKACEKAVNNAEFNDPPVRVIECMTNEKILFFTDLGNCYPISVEQIPEARAKERGLPPGGLLAGLEKDEQLVGVVHAGKWEGEVLLATCGGMIKRTVLADLNVRKSRYACISLKGDDRLLIALKPAGEASVLAITEGAMAIHFALEDVSVIGRTAAGVKAITLAPEDKLRYLFLHNSEGEVILASDLGYLKRCLLIDFERQARGGKGVKCMNLLKNGANGKQIAGALMVTDPYDFNIVQKSGLITSFNTEDVAIETKNGKGQPYAVVVMGDVVVGLSR